jgi:hypothetical protein
MRRQQFVPGVFRSFPENVGPHKDPKGTHTETPMFARDFAMTRRPRMTSETTDWVGQLATPFRLSLLK